jgi:hypothetical protein
VKILALEGVNWVRLKGKSIKIMSENGDLESNNLIPANNNNFFVTISNCQGTGF